MIREIQYAPREVRADLSGFDAIEYSRFKYGATKIAGEYAQEILDVIRQEIMGQSVEVVFSPNSFLPTASHSIANQLLELLLTEGMDATRLQVRRKSTYTRDYGKMNAQERMRMISGDSYAFVSTPRPEATLVFIDDVSITGTHQAVLESLCHRSGIKNRQVHAYYGARRDNNLSASIEAELNHAFIKTAEQALELIYQPDFVLNTRMTKFLLADASFPNFVSALPNQFRRNLLNGARGNQYAAIAAYRHNFELLVRSQDPEMFPLER